MVIRFLRDESGQSMAEYALLLTLIGLVAVFFLWTMGGSVNQIFAKVIKRLQTTEDAILIQGKS